MNATMEVDPRDESRFNRSLQFKEATIYAEQVAADPTILSRHLTSIRTTYALSESGNGGLPTEHMIQNLKLITTSLQMYSWEILENRILPQQAALTLLDELTRSENLANPLDSNIHTLLETLMCGWVNSRFEKSHNWQGALTALHSITLAALGETKNTERIQTWLNIFLSKHSVVLPVKSIANTGFILSFRNPTVEYEPILRKGMDINNAVSTAAALFGKTAAFKERSQANIRAMQPFIDKGLTDQKVPPEFRDTVQAIRQNYGRYLLLQKFLDTAGSNPYITSMRSVRVDPGQKGIPYPQNVVMMPTELTTLTHKLKGMVQTQEELFILMKEKAEQQDPPGTIVKFHHKTLSGYLIVPAGIQLSTSQDEKRNIISELIETNNLEALYAEATKNIPLHEGFVGITVNGITAFIYTKAYVHHFESLVDTIIPDEMRPGSRALSDILLMRTESARSFNRSLTQTGVRFILAKDERFPNVIDHVVLKLSKPGNFTFDIHLYESVDVRGSIRLQDGRTTLEFSGDSDRLPENFKWLFSHIILQLFISQCCVSHENIPDALDGATPVKETQPHEPGTYPAGIVHIGAVKKDLSPGDYTKNAVRNHAHDVYNLEFPTKATLEEMIARIHEVHGRSLLEINSQHRKEHAGCPQNLTWRISSEREPGKHPALASAPSGLFSNLLAK